MRNADLTRQAIRCYCGSAFPAPRFHYNAKQNAKKFCRWVREQSSALVCRLRPGADRVTLLLNHASLGSGAVTVFPEPDPGPLFRPYLWPLPDVPPVLQLTSTVLRPPNESLRCGLSLVQLLASRPGQRGTKRGFVSATSELTWKERVGQGEVRSTGGGLLSAETDSPRSCGKKGQAGVAGHVECG